MLGQGLIHKKLWGRSLWGLLAAVVMMWLAQLFFIGSMVPGIAASGRGIPEELARADAEFWLWGSISCGSLVVATLLLGIGTRPAPSNSKSTHQREPLPLEDRLDWFQYSHEPWFLPIQKFLRRLVLAMIGTFVLFILTIIVITVRDILRRT